MSTTENPAEALKNSITIAVNEVTKKSVELELPYYCRSKSGAFAYKIINKDDAISVYESGTVGKMLQVSISAVSPESVFSSPGYSQITAEEFDKKYEIAKDILDGLAI